MLTHTQPPEISIRAWESVLERLRAIDDRLTRLEYEMARVSTLLDGYPAPRPVRTFGTQAAGEGVEPAQETD